MSRAQLLCLSLALLCLTNQVLARTVADDTQADAKPWKRRVGKILDGIKKVADRTGMAVKRGVSGTFDPSNKWDWDIDETMEEYVHKIQLREQLGELRLERRSVILIPSLLGSSLYLREKKPSKYIREKCGLEDGGMVWLSDSLIVRSILSKVHTPWGNGLRKCFAKLLRLDSEVIGNVTDDVLPVHYNESPGQHLSAAFNDVDDVQHLGELLARLTDHTDAYDALVDSLHSLGFKDGETLFAAQYDWRQPLDVNQEGSFAQEYTQQLVELLEGATQERKAVIVAYSLGCSLLNGALMYMHEHRPHLLQRIDCIVQIAGGEAGAVSTLTGFLFGDSNSDMLFHNTRDTLAALRSQGSWPWVLPQGRVSSRKWLHIKDKDGQEEHFNTRGLSAFFARYYPEDTELRNMGAAVDWLEQTGSAARWEKIRAAYRHVPRLHCMAATGLPTLSDVYLQELEDGRVKQVRSSFTLAGDGLVSDESLDACKELASLTSGDSSFSLLNPTKREVAQGLKKSGGENSHLVRQKFGDAAGAAHSLIGRHYKPAMEFVIAEATGLPLPKSLPIEPVPKPADESAEEQLKGLAQVSDEK